MTAAVGTCRTCDAPVYWLRHDGTGRIAPIDVVPADNGNIGVDLAAGTYRILAPPAPSLFPDTVERRLNHWITCTNPPKRP